MTINELRQYSYVNEEELGFLERVRLHTLCKGLRNETIAKLFNTTPKSMLDVELIYVSKYLTRDYSFYVQGNNLYIGPTELTPEQRKEFNIPLEAEKKSSDEVYKTNGLGYRNLRVYDIKPGLKYKLIKGKSLTGYASIDKPWALFSEKVKLKNETLFDFFKESRNFLAESNSFKCYEQNAAWKEFETMVNNFTASLIASGVQKGDHVAICMHPSIEAVAIFFAADALGATSFFIDPENTSIKNMNTMFTRINSKIVFTNNKFADDVHEAMAGTNIRKVVAIKPLSTLDRNNISDFTREYLDKNDVNYTENNDVESLDKFFADGISYRDKIDDYKCYDNDTVSLITSTSGSTGEPKLPKLTRKNLMYELAYIKKTTHIDIGPGGVNMQVVPFRYPYGFVISTLLSIYVGKTAGICPDLTPNNYIEFLNLYKPTYIHAIPSFYKNMMNDKRMENADLSFLKFAVSGGDFYDYESIVETNEFFKAHGSKAKIKNGSGSAEVTACMTAATVGKYNIESVGKPLVGTTVKVMDENGNELPYGHMGTLYYSGGNLMDGYYNDVENTSKVKFTDSNGVEWLITDSIGFIDNEGFVYMCGRARNFFITYGENGAAYKVYTQQVERIIKTCSGVRDCIVVKQDDDSRMLVPKAYIVPEPNVDIEKLTDEINYKCRMELDKCAVPTSIEYVDYIKQTEARKVDIQYYELLANEEQEKGKRKL